VIFGRIAPGKKAVSAWDDWGAPPAKSSWHPFPKWKPSLIEIATIAAIVGVLICLLIPTGDHDFAHRYPPPVPIAGNGFAAVAGESYQGDGRGWNLRLSILPDGRYSFVWSGCLGVYHRESGFVRDVGGYLALSPIKQIEPRMARVFAPLKWGRRTYLIPPESLQEFCDAIIAGDEPRENAHGRFYALGLDGRADGVPDLPSPWAAYLRENLVIGTIVEVKGGRVKVDVGSSDGLRVDGVLTVQGRGRARRKLRVAAVDEHSCQAEEGDPGEFKNPLEVGWKVVAAREPL